MITIIIIIIIVYVIIIIIIITIIILRYNKMYSSVSQLMDSQRDVEAKVYELDEVTTNTNTNTNTNL